MPAMFPFLAVLPVVAGPGSSGRPHLTIVAGLIFAADRQSSRVGGEGQAAGQRVMFCLLVVYTLDAAATPITP